jgi:hypothetical protein
VLPAVAPLIAQIARVAEDERAEVVVGYAVHDLVDYRSLARRAKARVERAFPGSLGHATAATAARVPLLAHGDAISPAGLVRSIRPAVLATYSIHASRRVPKSRREADSLSRLRFDSRPVMGARTPSPTRVLPRKTPTRRGYCDATPLWGLRVNNPLPSRVGDSSPYRPAMGLSVRLPEASPEPQLERIRQPG